MDYEYVATHDDNQHAFQTGSPSSAAFLALPDDSGPFLFSSDSSSSNPSISSNSPPNDWSTWPEPEQLLDYSSQAMFNSAGISPSQLHTFDLGFPQNYVVDMLNSSFPVQPTVIQPDVLLQKPNPSLPVQPQNIQLQTPIPPNTSEDLNAAVKRLVGITSARIPGQYEPQSIQSSPEVMHAVPAVPQAPVSYTSHVHPQPPPSTASTSNQPSPAPQQVGPSGRPKTAHTTIERRYRTNLNTCIIGLRNAIPAVRFLDKAFKPANGVPDAIDEHGCIDGVKCARKISKATILSKAREYITVLKKRETKLSHELEGIKSLVSSLVGGPALLEEWERQWNAQYIQEETADLEAVDEVESGDEDEDGSDEERPKKRPRTSATTSASKAKAKTARVPSAIAMEPIAPPPRAETPTPAKSGKKRGRPTKAMAAQRVSTAGPAQQLPQYIQTAQSFTFVPPQSQAPAPAPAPAQQQLRPAYLLASFVFLSFFKPSSTIHLQHSHHHDTGAVLSPLVQHAVPTFLGVRTDVLHHLLHTLVMLGVFVALVATALPSLKAALRPSESTVVVEVNQVDNEEKIMEDNGVRVSLGERSNSISMAEDIICSTKCDKNMRKKAISRLQSVISAEATAEELGLLALLEYNTQPIQASTLWKRATDLASPTTSPAHLAFDLPIKSAIDILAQIDFQSSPEHRSPLLAIASQALETRLGEAIQQSFVEEVDAICGVTSALDHDALTKSREIRVQLTTMARVIGGHSALLADEWEVALAGRWPKSKLGADSRVSTPSTAIVHAIGLIRRVFPYASKDGVPMIGMIPSPPPSPLMQDEVSRMERELRVTLGSSAFYDLESRAHGEDVGRARDAVISRMTSVARMRRNLAVDGGE